MLFRSNPSYPRQLVLTMFANYPGDDSATLELNEINMKAKFSNLNNGRAMREDEIDTIFNEIAAA